MYHTYFFSSCPIRCLGRFTSYPGLGLADEITSSIIYHAFPYIEHIPHKSRLNDKSIIFLRCAPITINYLYYVRYSSYLHNRFKVKLASFCKVLRLYWQKATRTTTKKFAHKFNQDYTTAANHHTLTYYFILQTDS